MRFRSLFKVWLILGSVLLLSCSYKKPAVFWYASGGTPELFALSRDADRGILSSKAGKLEYGFSAPLKITDEYSLELSYQWNGEGEAQAVLDTGDLSWELPRDLSFLDMEKIQEAAGQAMAGSSLIRYTVPLASGNLEKIILRLTKGEGSKDQSLVIRSIALIPRWYGFRVEENQSALCLSPFVYSRDHTLVIDPPVPFRIREPELKIGFGAAGSFIAAANEQNTPGYFMIEGEAPQGLFRIPAFFFSSASYPLEIKGPEIESAELLTGKPFSTEPIPSDPGMILRWPRDHWRDERYELFSWAAFPSILIFDMADYDVQDRFLKRLAFFAEKAGFRGRLAPDSEIAGLHGWNAHDYRSVTLAAFFDLAEKTGFPLLPEEKELESILVNYKIILRNSNGIVPGAGALISITRESPDYLRSLFMVHEGFHGLYFIDEDFRNFCRQRWENFTGVPRAFILSYFEYQAYDTKDTDLVINEFMAHILQQPASQADRYFGETLAGRIDASPWRRTVLPPKDESTESWPLLAGAFRAEAEIFSRYVNQRWGLAAGRVRKIRIDLN